MPRRDWFEFAAELLCSFGSVLFAWRLTRRGRTHETRRL